MVRHRGPLEDEDDSDDDEDERKLNDLEEEEPALAGKSNTRHPLAPLPPWLRDAFNGLAAECEN